MADPARLGAATGTIVLVRHGESTWIAEGRFQGRADPPLSSLGERQAALVGDRLAQRDEPAPLPIPAGPPVGVWHSPLARAATTARRIADAQPEPIPLHPAVGLTEIAQGEWEGRTLSDVKSLWAAELAAWRHSPATDHAPGGEPLPVAARRVVTALADICGQLSQAALGEYAPVPGYHAQSAPTDPAEPWAIAVAHDGIFRLALMSLLGVPIERFWAFPFNLCAITVVALHEGVAALRAHNLSGHLAPLAVEARAAAEARGDRRGAL